MTPPFWLPALVTLADHGGDWNEYLAALYSYFTADFVADRQQFRGEKLALKRHPMIDGKEAAFWHIISEGKVEVERLPDMRRCERIRWPRPVIEHEAEPVVRVWKNRRGSEDRICLWLEAADYLVVLARRKGYLLLWTAYPVTEPHQKRKLQREYEEAPK
jgi:hypothetical protein